MHKRKRFKITDILIGVVFTLFFISLSVIITINFRPLYYFDVNYLNIVETSGYSKEEIIDNYNALIDYSSPFFQGRLEFPTLPSSESGIQHFEEVKNIFTFFYLLVALSFIIVIMIILQKIKKKDYSFLPVSAITAIVLPLTLGLFMAIDFDTSFLVFHKLFFNNDYWLFDPATDPVINILPDTFFLHSALLIILLVLLGSLSLYLIYLHLNKKTGIKHRKIKGIKI